MNIYTCIVISNSSSRNRTKETAVAYFDTRNVSNRMHASQLGVY